MTDYEVHEPGFDGTTTGGWDAPRKRDFDPGETRVDDVPGDEPRTDRDLPDEQSAQRHRDAREEENLDAHRDDPPFNS